MKKEQLSKCCNSPVVVKEKTKRIDPEYLCLECNKSCELVERKMITKNIPLEIDSMLKKEMNRTGGEIFGSDTTLRGQDAIQIDFENDEIKGRVIILTEGKGEYAK